MKKANAVRAVLDAVIAPKVSGRTATLLALAAKPERSFVPAFKKPLLAVLEPAPRNSPVPVASAV